MSLTISDFFQNHSKAVLPELFFVTAITIIPAYGVVWAQETPRPLWAHNPSSVHRFPVLTKVIGWLSVQAPATTLLLVGCGGLRAASAGTNVSVFNSVVIPDDLTLIVKCVISLSALPPIRISLDHTKGQKINSFEHYVPISFSTLSMLFIVPPYDSISTYSAIELQSLSFYVIAAIQRGNEFSAEAGPKYFILGAPSSGSSPFGESIIHGLTGITNSEELTKSFTFRSGYAFDM